MPQHAARTGRAPPGGKRLGAAEVDRRLAAVEKLLRDGSPRHVVVSVMRRMFAASPRTVDDYMRRVRERWADERTAAEPSERARTEARLTALAAKLEGRGAWAALVQVERLLVDVRGLRAARTLDVRALVNIDDPAPETWTIEEAGREIEEAAAALARYRAKHRDESAEQGEATAETRH